MPVYSSLQRRWFQTFAKVHGALLVRTNGRPSRLGRGRSALVLETVGRKSGATRVVPLLYMLRSGGFIVLASNYGQERPPAWWFNLQARPDATILVSGRRVPVHPRLTTGAERDGILDAAVVYNELWRGYRDHLSRELPVVFLERR
jgi:deazaflavin-dependent oxidoreductase (nitroreductase family)